MPIRYKETTQKPQDSEVDCDCFEHVRPFGQTLSFGSGQCSRSYQVRWFRSFEPTAMLDPLISSTPRRTRTRSEDPRPSAHLPAGSGAQRQPTAAEPIESWPSGTDGSCATREQLPQVHRIHGLGQVMIEARFERAPTVFVASVAGERDQPRPLGARASGARGAPPRTRPCQEVQGRRASAPVRPRKRARRAVGPSRATRTWCPKTLNSIIKLSAASGSSSTTSTRRHR